jgi:hypothetical protein
MRGKQQLLSHFIFFAGGKALFLCKYPGNIEHSNENISALYRNKIISKSELFYWYIDYHRLKYYWGTSLNAWNTGVVGQGTAGLFKCPSKS